MAKKKSNYFKTKAEIKKTAQNSIMETVVASASGVVMSMGYTAVSGKIPAKGRKYIGVGLLGVGAGLNVYAKDSLVKAGANGLATFGAIQTVLDLAPDNIKSKMSFGSKGIGAISDEDYAAIEAEVEAEFDALKGNEGSDFDQEPGVEMNESEDVFAKMQQLKRN